MCQKYSPEQSNTEINYYYLRIVGSNLATQHHQFSTFISAPCYSQAQHIYFHADSHHTQAEIQQGGTHIVEENPPAILSD